MTPSSVLPSPMNAAALQARLRSDLLAECVQQLDLTVLAVQPDAGLLALPVTAKDVHGAAGRLAAHSTTTCALL